MGASLTTVRASLMAVRASLMQRAPLKLAATCAGLVMLAGCSIQPWVKPYERDRLADPIMSWDRDAISAAYMDHIYDSREGSRGATGTAGGGCGCN